MVELGRHDAVSDKDHRRRPWQKGLLAGVDEKIVRPEIEGPLLAEARNEQPRAASGSASVKWNLLEEPPAISNGQIFMRTDEHLVQIGR